MNAIEKYQRLLNATIDNDDFESFEDLENEDLENFSQMGFASRRMGSRRMGSGGNQFGMPKVVIRPAESMPRVPGAVPASAIAAQFDFTITRLSKDIPHDLPVLIFNPLGWDNDLDIVAPFLPSNVSIINVSQGVDSYEITFSDSVNTDILQVKLSNSRIRGFMKSLYNVEMNVNKFRFICDKDNTSRYYSTTLRTCKKSFLGKVSDVDTIQFISNQNPNTFRENILDIDVNFAVQNDKGIIYHYPVIANMPLSLSVFVNKLIVK